MIGPIYTNKTKVSLWLVLYLPTYLFSELFATTELKIIL